jgi:hypothetical protein
MVEGQCYGVALFLWPAQRAAWGLITKLEKTSKQTQDFVLHFIVFACLGEREARAGVLGSTGNIQARKNKQA